MKNKTLAVILSGMFVLQLLYLAGSGESLADVIESPDPNAVANIVADEILPPEIIKLILTAKGNIGNLVWDDDGDGVYDPDKDYIIPGVTVFADLNGDGIRSPGEPFGVTDSKGNYEITELRARNYHIYVDQTTLPEGYYVITNHPMDIKIDQRVDINDVDFGTQNRSASLTGIVWNDSDGDGSVNNAEQPLAGVTVYVDTDRDGTTLGDPNSVTNSSGQYQINNLPLGSFIVTLRNDTLPSAYYQEPVSGSPNPVPVNFQHQATNTVNFGYVKEITISGILKDSNGNTWGSVQLFIDLNGNGKYDEGEPTAITDKFGRYSFDNLLPGTYTIFIMDGQLPPGYAFAPISHTIGEGVNYVANLTIQAQAFTAAPMVYPTRVSWDGIRNLYVSDNKSGVVSIYDSKFALQRQLVNLNEPLAVSGDNSGKIYVGLQGTGTVVVYDDKGNLVGSIGSGIVTPNDISFDDDGNMYILDSSNDVVRVYDPSGSLVRSIGDASNLDYGVSIAIRYTGTGTGELYIADLQKSLIQVFSLQGAFLRSIGGPATVSQMNPEGPVNWTGKFAGLKAIDFDQHGILHALDTSLNVVSMFDPTTGAYIGYYDAYLPANNTKLNLQNDISINGQGQVVQANAATRNVETINMIP